MKMNINDLCVLESVDDDRVVKAVKERYEADYIYVRGTNFLKKQMKSRSLNAMMCIL